MSCLQLPYFRVVNLSLSSNSLIVLPWEQGEGYSDKPCHRRPRGATAALMKFLITILMKTGSATLFSMSSQYKITDLSFICTTRTSRRCGRQSYIHTFLGVSPAAPVDSCPATFSNHRFMIYTLYSHWISFILIQVGGRGRGRVKEIDRQTI